MGALGAWRWPRRAWWTTACASCCCRDPRRSRWSPRGWSSPSAPRRAPRAGQAAAVARGFDAGRRAALADRLARRPEEPERAERLLAQVDRVSADEVVALARAEITAGREIVVVRGPRAVVEELRIGRRAPRLVDAR